MILWTVQLSFHRSTHWLLALSWLAFFLSFWLSLSLSLSLWLPSFCSLFFSLPNSNQTVKSCVSLVSLPLTYLYTTSSMGSKLSIARSILTDCCYYLDWNHLNCHLLAQEFWTEMVQMKKETRMQFPVTLTWMAQVWLEDHLSLRLEVLLYMKKKK